MHSENAFILHRRKYTVRRYEFHWNGWSVLLLLIIIWLYVMMDFAIIRANTCGWWDINAWSWSWSSYGQKHDPLRVQSLFVPQTKHRYNTYVVHLYFAPKFKNMRPKKGIVREKWSKPNEYIHVKVGFDLVKVSDKLFLLFALHNGGHLRWSCTLQFALTRY